ncbi:MAG: DJ-1/PfpI family protein [Candidatus Calescibacterium sp.]|nr:DJ-1/PfpI family protein [Candidatus Calescibacterium sp.]MCX7972493.1 DJ-1/PfpI family protein [bacterium]MDW8195615.1 DJ-1/PfpI family protein [Candidatus Calescibacterium sp.]
MVKPKVLTIVTNGVEEMELVITVDILRRGGVDVDIASLQEEVIECSRMVKILPDLVIQKVLKDQNLEDFLNQYHALYIPGGSNNAQNLKKSTLAKQIIEHFISNQKILAAICAGPTVINHHHKLENYKATCYPTLKDEIPNFVNHPVVEDKNLITSQGPATTFEFSLKLLEKIKNKETRYSVSKATLFEEYYSKVNQ